MGKEQYYPLALPSGPGALGFGGGGFTTSPLTKASGGNVKAWIRQHALGAAEEGNQMLAETSSY